MGYVILKTTCGEEVDAKTIDVKYLIINIVSPYNIILGRPTINILWAVMSTQYLSLEYLLLDGLVSTIRGDQQVAREYYLSSLDTAREELILVNTHLPEVPNTNFEDWNPKLGAKLEQLMPI